MPERKCKCHINPNDHARGPAVRSLQTAGSARSTQSKRRSAMQNTNAIRKRGGAMAELGSASGKFMQRNIRCARCALRKVRCNPWSRCTTRYPCRKAAPMITQICSPCACSITRSFMQPEVIAGTTPSATREGRVKSLRLRLCKAGSDSHEEKSGFKRGINPSGKKGMCQWRKTEQTEVDGACVQATNPTHWRIRL